MKKSLTLSLALGLSVFSSQAIAGPSPHRGDVIPSLAKEAGIIKNYGGEGIVGSSHDLSYDPSYTDKNGPHNNVGANRNSTAGVGAGSGQADVQKRICIFCHHPHNSYRPEDIGINYSPLWNREMSEQTFNGYTNGLDANVIAATASDKRHNLNAADEGGGTAIAGISLLCMSCHDGVVAMNAYSINSGSNDGQGVAGEGGTLGGRTSGFSGDMSNHHPMGFDYQAVQTADAEIAATNTALVPDGSVRISDVLSNGKMECVTCHDVHNTANQSGAERFLWRTNDYSNFCLTCHLK